MVTAWPIPPVESRVGDSMGYRAGHSWAVWAQTAAVTLLRRSVLDVPPLTGVVVEGSPADVLARAGEGTAGIVLGHRPDDPSTAAASSTRERCMALATCPVVVVPDLPGRPPVQDGGSGVDTTARRRSAATRAGSRVPA
jgi:hypothetical protein